MDPKMAQNCLCLILILACTPWISRAAIQGKSDCSKFPVQSTRDLSAPYINSDKDRGLYTRFTEARGVRIFGGDGVSDYLLADTARVIAGVMDRLVTPLSVAIREKKWRIYFLPGFGVCGGTACVGSITVLPFNEPERCNALDSIRHGCLLHEFGHAVNCEYSALDRDINSRVSAAYTNAKRKKIWPADWYAMTNGVEYFGDFFEAMWYKADAERLLNKDTIKRKDPDFYHVYRDLRRGDELDLSCSMRCDPRTVVRGVFHEERFFS